MKSAFMLLIALLMVACQKPRQRDWRVLTEIVTAVLALQVIYGARKEFEKMLGTSVDWTEVDDASVAES